MIHPATIRSDFPIFRHHPELIYLDSAATTLKPTMVIETERAYLEKYSANISRGLYDLSTRATEAYEKTRDAVTHWISAQREEIIFTSGTTASINLLSYTLQQSIAPHQNIVVTEADHHANFLPWQALAERVGAEFRVIPVSESGEIHVETLEKFLDKNTAVFAFPHISNVLGSVAPVRSIAEQTRILAPHARIVLDAAQSVSHMSLNVNKLGVDFIAFSAHKCFGPTGVGILWGKIDILNTLPPFLYGGDMVESATQNASTFKKPPYRFEAGTPNISGVIAFRAAIEYIEAIGMENIREHETHLTQYADTELRKHFPNIRILGPEKPSERGSLISFILPDIHAHDIAEVLAKENICVRAGAHCAHPLHVTLGIPASLRISWSIYNTQEDIDHAIAGIQKAQKIFSKETGL